MLTRLANRVALFAVGLVALGFLSAKPVSGQATKLIELLERTPSPGNTVVYLNVPKLKELTAAREFTVQLPKNVDETWMIADIDLIQLAPKWEAGFASLRVATAVDALVKTTGGYIDQIGDKKFVWTPQHSYLLPTDASHVGFLRPANRALLSDWLHTDSSHHVDDYLAKEAMRPEKFLSLLFAVDLEHMFSPIALERSLTGLKAMDGQPIQTMARLLSGCQGVSLIVGRESLSQCIVSLQFDQSPQKLAPVCVDLVHELLERNLTPMPELLSWKPKVKGNTLELHGSISEQTLDRVLGILTLGNHAGRVSSPSDQDIPKFEKEDASVAYTTKKYFEEVGVHIESVRRHQAKTAGSLAKWNDIQARRIDEIYTVGVDETVVEYGVAVAKALRNDASAITNININAGKSKASTSSYDGYYGNRYGTGFNHTNYSTESNRITGAYARGNAYQDFRQMMKDIDQLTADVKRAMEQKYKMPF